MKITKRQLRRIIQEERDRLLSETIADTGLFEVAIREAALQVSDMFGESMMRLFDEDPEMFKGRSTQEEWQAQVTGAQQLLDTGIVTAIEEKIQEVENMLHDGQFHGTDRGQAWDRHVAEFGEPTDEEMSGGGGLSENEARALKDMPPAWRQILGTCLKDKI